MLKVKLLSISSRKRKAVCAIYWLTPSQPKWVAKPHTIVFNKTKMR